MTTGLITCDLCPREPVYATVVPTIPTLYACPGCVATRTAQMQATAIGRSTLIVWEIIAGRSS